MARYSLWCTLPFVVSLFTILKIEAFSFGVNRIYRLNKIEMCDFGSTPPLVLVTNIIGSGGKNQLTVSGVMNVTQDLTAPWKLINNTTRCSRPGNECEIREPFVTDRICDIVFVPVFAVLNAFQPPILGCSIKKNIYTVSNATFDMMIFSAKYHDNWRWQSKLRITNAKNELVFCTNFDWSMLNMPRKRTRPQRP